MNKHSIGKILMALAVCVSLLAGNSVTAYASTQEVQGTDTQTKDIKVTADIQSVYSVSLPASIELSYGEATDSSGNKVAGYWYNLKYGVAGKISSFEEVFVNVECPCVLTNTETGDTISISELDNYEQLTTSGCKNYWSSTEIGSCEFDGTTLTNCEYSYCCENGHAIGIKEADITVYGSYEGNLTFQFGIDKN